MLGSILESQREFEEGLMSYWVSASESINVSLWIWVLDLWIYAIRDLVKYLVLGFSILFGC